MKNLLYILILFLLASCSTSSLVKKTDKSSIKSDSTYHSMIMKIDTVTIPADTLRIEIPIEVFKRDTVIQDRNGRASAKITYRDGKLRIDTKCDSLSELVLSYEERLYQSKVERESLIQSSKEKIIKRTPFYYRISLWISIALIIYTALNLFLSRFQKINKQIINKLP